MKKYILPFMSIAMLMAMASCSSSDDEVAEIKEESKLVPMTFTATQESNAGTRSALNSDNKVVWQTNDGISVFDGNGAGDNHIFTLTGNVEDGKFSGEASSEAATFTAVYPYTDGAQLGEDGSVSGIELLATQTAKAGSFDPNAALMMAVSTTENKNQLDFKNAISLVKVTPQFNCTKIELEAAEESSDILAGKGTLNWNNGQPTINITNNFSKKITLSGSITQRNSYYIVVPTGTLNRMWKITFTADDGKKYTRYCSKPLTIERNKIINLGNFATDSPFWADEHRGTKVTYEQEVDLGLTIEGSDSKTYKVIFANANLTATGLAASETDYGDYFAWGATMPWYDSLDITSSTWQATWKYGKSGGYKETNCPSYVNDAVYVENSILKMEYDPARKILEGDWQIPTQDIWRKLIEGSLHSWINTKQGYEFVNNDQTLFLPAAGYVDGVSFIQVGSNGYYWSGTASLSTHAYRLTFHSYDVNAESDLSRYYGHSVRPVRLVAVQPQQ